MGVQVIPIPTEVVSHSLPLPFPILCFIPVPMGFPVPLGIPFPCTSLVWSQWVYEHLISLAAAFCTDCTVYLPHEFVGHSVQQGVAVVQSK